MAKRLPPELYQVIPALYPHFVDILNSANVTGPQFFVLSFVRHRGQEIQPGVTALPVSDIKDNLVKAGVYESVSGAAGFIGSLEAKGWLRHIRITRQQKDEVFPLATGYRDVLVLTAAGERLLDEVNRLVDALFARLSAGVPRPVMTALVAAIKRSSGKIVTKLNDLSDELASARAGEMPKKDEAPS